MSKFTKILGAVAAVLTLNSGLSYAQNASTDYIYDARGRLIKVDNASGEVNYNYDDAGNRTSVTATSTPPSGGGGGGGTPTIDSFSDPRMVMSGRSFSVSWQSSNTTTCEISVSAADGTSPMMTMSSVTTYPNLATSGSRSLTLYQTSNVMLTCRNGSSGVSVNRVVDVMPGNEVGF
ncbi:MAG: RHS repeat domain-containing protein [Idiomarina sp.]